MEATQSVGWVQATPWLPLRGGVGPWWGSLEASLWFPGPPTPTTYSHPTWFLHREQGSLLQHPAAVGTLLVTSPHYLTSNVGCVGPYTVQSKGLRARNT